MESPSSDDRRTTRNNRSRGKSRDGARSGGSRRNTGNRSSSRNRAPKEQSQQKPTPPPPLTGFQKFLKLITFGLYDPSPKKAPSTRTQITQKDRSEKKPADDQSSKRKRRTPVFVEPTTPRLYIGNLSYDATSDDLRTLFSAHGSVVDATIVTQPGSERSKGFAFVEMSTLEEAKAAASALNNHEFQGREILVTGAKSETRDERKGSSKSGERGERGSSSRERGGERRERNGRGRERGNRDEVDKPTRQVRPLVIETVTSPVLAIRGLNAEASDEDLNELFSGIGTIASREEIGTAEDGLSRQLKVELSDITEAQKAVELLDGKSFMGRQLRITGADQAS